MNVNAFEKLDHGERVQKLVVRKGRLVRFWVLTSKQKSYGLLGQKTPQSLRKLRDSGQIFPHPRPIDMMESMVCGKGVT